MSYDTEKIETGVTASATSNPPAEMPRNDIVFVAIPPGGFESANIQKYIRAGYVLWGIVPLVAPKTASDLILPEGLLPPAVEYLVLRLDTNAVPVNILAHHIVKAKQDKGGLNQLSQVFFDLTLKQLEDGLKEARAAANGR